MNGKTDYQIIPDALLLRLSEYLTAKIGLHFPNRNRNELHQKMTAAMTDFGFENVGEFIEWLLSSSPTQKQTEILASHLTVGETYFFREMKSLDAFRTHIIPGLIRRRSGGDQRIRIWSAGCSTGEEAYTLAMILAELIPDLKDWKVDIRATDINPRSLDKARRGIYTEWSFRGLPEPVRERYFEPQGDKAFAVRPRFKNMVSFACLNLASNTYPSLQNDTNALDVIFCRNVMMYFTPERVRTVIRRFQQCLVEGGWFIVAPCETSMLLDSELVSVPFPGATLYRKDSRKPAANAPTPLRSIAAQPVPETRQPVPPPVVAEQAAPASKVQLPASAFRLPTSDLPDPYEAALAAYGAGRYADTAVTLQTLFGSDGFRAQGNSAAQAFALMARLEANQGKLNHAAEWAGKAIAADKVNPGFYYLLSTILEELHRPRDAVQALKRALYLDSAFVLAHFALGNLALHENGRKDADRHFRNATELLASLPKDSVLPESEGMAAGRLLEIIETINGD